MILCNNPKGNTASTPYKPKKRVLTVAGRFKYGDLSIYCNSLAGNDISTDGANRKGSPVGVSDLPSIGSLA